jgi:ribosome recycling factor
VTKELREKLVVGARNKLNSCKDCVRAVGNSYTKRAAEAAPPAGVSQDDLKEAAAAIRLVTDTFLARAEGLLATKARELTGK